MMEIPFATTGASRSHSIYTLPGIQIHCPFNPTTSSGRTGSEPMPIPHVKDAVPPPLPPPRHIADPDLALHYIKERHDEPKTLPPIQPGSSLLAGLPPSSSSRSADGSKSPEPPKRSRNVSPLMEVADASPRRDAVKHMDEGYASLPGSMPMPRVGLRAQEPSWDSSQNWSDSYDKSMLDKLKAAPADRPPRTINATLRPLRRPTEGGNTVDGPLPSYSQTSPGTDRKDFGALPLPDPRASPASMSGSVEDIHMRSGVTPDSAVSMMSGQSGFAGRSFLSPRIPPRQSSTLSSVAETGSGRRESDIAARRSASGTLMDAVNGADHIPGGMYGPTIFAEPEPESSEESQMRRLRLGEPEKTPPRRRRYSPHSKAGRKRRASSPPRERDERHALSTSANSNELFHRRSSGHLPGGRQTPPVSRFPVGSLSSSSSVTGTGSTVSSSGMTLLTNSLTSLSSSHDRVSPASGLSPSSELESSSPYVRSLSLNPSPHESLSKAHHRTASETKPAAGVRRTSRDDSSQTKQHSLQRMHGVWICECCPKKPKKFDSQEELRLHTTEKQYTCQYCNNRFKNKNEAERHQNSLHLRRHSWSCAALVDYKAAFHASPYKSSSTGASTADVCGYCGEQFPLPADWNARFEHLTNVHKFGECNKAKKFFRADHFRQHLKHSHAGTSGKWTNMLETACMKDEPPPERASSALTDGGGVIGNVIDEDPEGEV